MGSKHLAGGKFSPSHSTAIDAVNLLCKYLNRQEFVDKISLGIITAFAGGRKSAKIAIKLSELPAGAKITVTEKTGAQVIFVYFNIDFKEFSEQLKLFQRKEKWQWRE